MKRHMVSFELLNLAVIILENVKRDYNNLKKEKMYGSR